MKRPVEEPREGPSRPERGEEQVEVGEEAGEETSEVEARGLINFSPKSVSSE